MTAFIDDKKESLGVEPICRELEVAPSTYYARRSRPPSARAIRHADLKVEIRRVFDENYCVYGQHKVWRQLNREGVDVGRDQVARLMRDLSICGVRRAKKHRTTVPDPKAPRAPDLVNRTWSVDRPNKLWVTDITEVATWSHRVYIAFVIDCFSRGFVGWRAATTMRTDLVLDALEMAIWRRDALLDGLVGHSDAGSQFTSIRFTERLGEIGAAPSIGSVGDPIDNAVAESTIGLFKTELIRTKGPWRHIDDLDVAIFEYVDWFNNRRLHGTIGDVPPAEFEAAYYRRVIEGATEEPIGVRTGRYEARRAIEKTGGVSGHRTIMSSTRQHPNNEFEKQP
jgi:putative transposase